MGIPEKIKRIEDEMSRTQINKATEHHIGLLKAKLAKLRREQDEARTRRTGSSIGYDVKRSMDGTAVLIGLPNVGKSTLLNRLTNSKSRIGGYQFTTLTVVPGVMAHRGALIQVLDLPGIIEGAASGKGLGKRVLSVARSADLVLFVLDVSQPEVLPLLKKEIRGIGIRPDEKPPNIVIEKTGVGGVSVNTQVELTKITPELVRDIVHVYGIHSARVMIRDDITDEQLIDVLLENRVYASTLTILNKIDLVSPSFVKELKSKLPYDFIPVSGDANLNIQDLKEQIYQKLNFIRIYMRPKGGETDYAEPMIVKKGASVLDVCNKVHRGLKDDLRYAQVWGKSAKFGGQKVGLTHKLIDEDVLTFVAK
jgi:ribosome-interacting GTPase 1